VPVIGSAGTGLVEVIDHDQNGFLMSVGDTDGMSAAAISLLSDCGRLLKFKQDAARLALEKFKADKIISQYESYYQEVLNGQTGRT